MDSGLLSLKWNHHNVSFQNMLSNIRSKILFSDVTLACGGKLYPVHKLVLSTCSEYFEVMLQETHCKHPVIVLKDISCADLDYLLDFMYIGEVNVPQTKLSGLIEAAECLRIRGLAVPDESEQDHIVKGAPLRNEKSNVNSHMRNKRLREESPETPHKKGQRSNDHAKYTKFSGVERNNNGHKTTALSFTVHDDSPRTEMSTSERTHMKNRNATSSVVDLAPINIKEEFHSSPIQDQIIALENDSIEDINNFEKLSEPDTLACSVSEANNRQRKSPVFGSSSLDFKEDVSQEFPSFDEKSNGQQLDVSQEFPSFDEKSNGQQLDSCFGGSESRRRPSAEQSVVGRISQQQAVSSGSGQWVDECPVMPLADSSVRNCPVVASIITCESIEEIGVGLLGDGHLVESVPGASPHVANSHNTSSSSLHGSSFMFSDGSIYSPSPDGAASYVIRGTGVQKVKQCSLCLYVTRRMSSMKQHLLTHTGYKPFACPYCSYRSTQKGTLRRHVHGHVKNGHHGDNLPVGQA